MDRGSTIKHNLAERVILQIVSDRLFNFGKSSAWSKKDQSKPYAGHVFRFRS